MIGDNFVGKFGRKIDLLLLMFVGDYYPYYISKEFWERRYVFNSSSTNSKLQVFGIFFPGFSVVF